MIDYVTIGLGLLRARVAALYHCDHLGRLVSVNQWGWRPGAAVLSDANTRQRRVPISADLPDDLVALLDDLGRQEPTPPGMLPALYQRYLDVLSAQAPVDRVWAGPAYMCSEDLMPSASVVPISEDNAELLRSGFSHWLPDVPHRQPFMAVVEKDRAVSICASVRISPAAHCAGVETQNGYRQRGYAASGNGGFWLDSF